MGINEYLFEKRYKTGIEKGLEEGIQQGAELERIKANEEKLAEKLEIARTLKNLGVTIANIAKATGLSIAETQAL